MYPELIYSTPFFISSFSIFIVGLYLSFQPRRPRGIWYLVFFCFSAALWSATEGLLYLGFNVDTNMRITYIQYLGTVPLPPLLLLFTLSFFGYDAWLNRKTYTVLSIAAAAILLLAWTHPLHHQVYVGYYRIDNGPVPMLGLRHGPLWWAIMAYHYALTAIVGLLLFRTARTTRGPLGRHAALLLGLVCIVWLFNGVYVSGNSPVPNMDLAPLAFILVAAAMAGGFYRYNFLGIRPVAKSAFFNALDDPILVLDTRNRLLDLNPAAEKLLGIQAADFVGRNIETTLEHRLQIDGLPETPSEEILPILVKGEERYFELSASELKDNRGSDVGHLFVFHDITDRKHEDDAMREQERLQGVLEIAGSVCEDMAQPIDTIHRCASQVLDALPDGHPQHDKGLKLAAQTRRLKETAQKLMGITQYKTRSYLGSNIIDIEKASTHGEGQ